MTVLNHVLSSVIGTLLAVLPVIGFLSRNVAALLPNVISSDPASELAKTLSRGAFYRATVSTGIADRVPAEHCRRSVIVAEDASVLIFGLGYNLDGRSDIWIARGRRHFARGLGIFLHGSEWSLVEQPALLLAATNILDGDTSPSSLTNFAALLDIDRVLDNDIRRIEVTIALISRELVLKQRADLDTELHPEVGTVVDAGVVDVVGYVRSKPLLTRSLVVLSRDDVRTRRLWPNKEKRVRKVAILVRQLILELVQTVGPAVAPPLDGNCLTLQLIVWLATLRMVPLPDDYFIDRHYGGNEGGNDKKQNRNTGPPKHESDACACSHTCTSTAGPRSVGIGIWGSAYSMRLLRRKVTHFVRWN